MVTVTLTTLLVPHIINRTLQMAPVGGGGGGGPSDSDYGSPGKGGNGYVFIGWGVCMD